MVVLCVFAARFCMWLCCVYLQRVSVFDCVACICSTFLYVVVLRVFTARFCMWLCCVYLQHVSVFGCVACIYSTCAAKLMKMFSGASFISMCFL